MTNPNKEFEIDPYLPIDRVAELLGISKTSIWRLSKAGQFPNPARFGSSVRWRRSVIEEYLADKQAEADAAVAHREAETGQAA